MSEQATHEQSAQEVWDRTMGAPAAPITKDAVRGDDPAPSESVLPDRALVTGQLNEIFGATEPAADPIADKLAALEDSLVPRQEPEHPEVYKEIQALRAELAERDAAAKEAEASEERDARLRTVREGFIEALRESEDFPAIKAAGYEEKLFDSILAKQQAGEEVSEETILSDMEASLWTIYDALHAAKHPTTTSEEPTPSEPNIQPPTLTPSLSAQDTARGLEDIYTDVGNDRKAAAVEVWNNIMNR